MRTTSGGNALYIKKEFDIVQRTYAEIAGGELTVWPWEHAAIGYIGYSLVCRARGTTPSDGAAIAVFFGSLLPDLIDKPLAWWFALLPAGRSLGHSLLLAVPVCIVVFLLTKQYARTDIGVAFTVGYLLHLPADVISPALFGGPLSTDFLLWPVTPVAESTTWGISCELSPSGVFDCLFGPLGVMYLVAELTLVGGAVVLWWIDGRPGLAQPELTKLKNTGRRKH